MVRSLLQHRRAWLVGIPCVLRARAVYQILTRALSGRYMRLPGLTPNAS